ncbi:MAG: hypothetical protein U1E65_14415 [Myxococcota bacterium]
MAWKRWFVLLLALWAPRAWAHKFEHPTVLRLGLRDGELLLSVVYDLNPGDESKQLRGLFDRDGNGSLDESERAKILDYLVRTVELWLKLRLDGAPLRLEKAQIQGTHLDSPPGSTESLGISILYKASIPVRAALRLEVEDRDKDAEKVVPLTLDLGPGWTLELASQGEWQPRIRSLERVFLGPSEGLRIELSRAALAPAANAPGGS